MNMSGGGGNGWNPHFRGRGRERGRQRWRGGRRDRGRSRGRFRNDIRPFEDGEVADLPRPHNPPHLRRHVNDQDRVLPPRHNPDYENSFRPMHGAGSERGGYRDGNGYFQDRGDYFRDRDRFERDMKLRDVNRDNDRDCNRDLHRDRDGGREMRFERDRFRDHRGMLSDSPSLLASVGPMGPTTSFSRAAGDRDHRPMHPSLSSKAGRRLELDDQSLDLVPKLNSGRGSFRQSLGDVSSPSAYGAGFRVLPPSRSPTPPVTRSSLPVSSSAAFDNRRWGSGQASSPRSASEARMSQQRQTSSSFFEAVTSNDSHELAPSGDVSSHSHQQPHPHQQFHSHQQSASDVISDVKKSMSEEPSAAPLAAIASQSSPSILDDVDAVRKGISEELTPDLADNAGVDSVTSAVQNTPKKPSRVGFGEGLFAFERRRSTEIEPFEPKLHNSLDSTLIQETFEQTEPSSLSVQQPDRAHCKSSAVSNLTSSEEKGLSVKKEKEPLSTSTQDASLPDQSPSVPKKAPQEHQLTEHFSSVSDIAPSLFQVQTPHVKVRGSSDRSQGPFAQGQTPSMKVQPPFLQESVPSIQEHANQNSLPMQVQAPFIHAPTRTEASSQPGHAHTVLYQGPSPQTAAFSESVGYESPHGSSIASSEKVTGHVGSSAVAPASFVPSSVPIVPVELPSLQEVLTEEESLPSQGVLLMQIERIDDLISENEETIIRRKSSLEHARQAEPDSDSEDVDSSPQRAVASPHSIFSGSDLQANIDQIYSENQRLARTSLSHLNRTRPSWMTDIESLNQFYEPLYESPSQCEVYGENQQVFDKIRVRLFRVIRRRKIDKDSANRNLALKWWDLYRSWLRFYNSLEKKSIKPRSRLPRPRKSLESEVPRIVGMPPNPSNELLIKTMAICPDQFLSESEKRRVRFLSRNGLVEDARLLESQRKLLNPWSEEEEELFKRKYQKYPKNFNKIASYFANKTVGDCVSHYYSSKTLVNYKQLARKYRRSVSRKTAQTSNEDTTITASMPALPSKSSTPREPNISRELLNLAADLSRSGMDIQQSRSRGTKKREHDDVDNRLKSKAKKLKEKAGREKIIKEKNAARTSKDKPKSKIRAKPKPISAIGIDTEVGAERKVDVHPVSADDGLERGSEESALSPVLEDGRKRRSSSSGPRPSWDSTEKQLFLEALDTFGKDFSMISEHVGTKSIDKCKNYFNNNKRKLQLKERLERRSPSLKNPDAKSSASETSGPESDGKDALTLQVDSAGIVEGEVELSANPMLTSPCTDDWSDSQKSRFMECFRQHGRDWSALQSAVSTKTEDQIKAFYERSKINLELPEIIEHEATASLSKRCQRSSWGSTSAAEVAVNSFYDDEPAQKKLRSNSLSINQPQSSHNSQLQHSSIQVHAQPSQDQTSSELSHDQIQHQKSEDQAQLHQFSEQMPSTLSQYPNHCEQSSDPSQSQHGHSLDESQELQHQSHPQFSQNQSCPERSVEKRRSQLLESSIQLPKSQDQDQSQLLPHESQPSQSLEPGQSACQDQVKESLGRDQQQQSPGQVYSQPPNGQPQLQPSQHNTQPQQPTQNQAQERVRALSQAHLQLQMQAHVQAQMQAQMQAQAHLLPHSQHGIPVSALPMPAFAMNPIAFPGMSPFNQQTPTVQGQIMLAALNNAASQSPSQSSATAFGHSSSGMFKFVQSQSSSESPSSSSLAAEVLRPPTSIPPYGGYVNLLPYAYQMQQLDPRLLTALGHAQASINPSLAHLPATFHPMLAYSHDVTNQMQPQFNYQQVIAQGNSDETSQSQSVQSQARPSEPVSSSQRQHASETHPDPAPASIQQQQASLEQPQQSQQSVRDTSHPPSQDHQPAVLEHQDSLPRPQT